MQGRLVCIGVEASISIAISLISQSIFYGPQPMKMNRLGRSSARARAQLFDYNLAYSAI